MLNAWHEDLVYTLPTQRYGRRWSVVFDTARPDLREGRDTLAAKNPLDVSSRSMVLLRRLDDARDD